jgi:V8-like Glu-specific endopeptidase
MKFRMMFAAIATMAAFAGSAAAAHAITNAEPDNGRHPWVGALVSHDPETGERYLICTGTLISKTVFLTAAHCLEDEPSDLEVSFDSFVGAPDVGPEVELHSGQAYGDPLYAGNSTGPEDTHDVAVVVLDRPVKGVKPAVLPARGALDRIERVADRIPWAVVGYGREGHGEDGFFGGGSRHFGFGSWLALHPFTFELSQRADRGEAGTCNGDSGGPIFIGKTPVLAGISVDGDPLCQENSINVRLDTDSARSFVLPFLRGKHPAQSHGSNRDDDDRDGHDRKNRKGDD